jgi:LuxR family maltose regulon positive regulatory protein
VQREHHLDEMPTLHIVPAMTALLAALDGRPDVAREESRLSRRNLSYFDGVSTWVSVPTRIVLAETSLLLGDRATAEHLLDETRHLLDAQPDALLAVEKVKTLVQRLHDSDRSLATGRFALTTAELRVLHYLPTNLRIPEIASRLYVSRFTVKTQASSIYRKLGAANRTEAVALACGSGLLQIDDARTP